MARLTALVAAASVARSFAYSAFAVRLVPTHVSRAVTIRAHHHEEDQRQDHDGAGLVSVVRSSVACRPACFAAGSRPGSCGLRFMRHRQTRRSADAHGGAIADDAVLTLRRGLVRSRGC